MLSKFISTTSTLSVGSTGSQARLIQSSHPPASYQPILMKDLGKQSPNKNINIIEIFSNGDEEQKLTDKAMDKHLSELSKDNNINKSDTCDIVKYMANLKEQHMEIQHQLDISCIIVNDDKMSDSELTVIEIDCQNSKLSDSSDEKSSDEKNSKISASVIDKKVDKVFNGDKSKSTPKKILKTTRSSIELSRSPDRSKSNGNSPVRIIKVKSPRNSVDSGKRLTVSRSNSKERSPDRTDKNNIKRSVSPKKHTDSILKRSLSPKPSFDQENILTNLNNGSILKRSNSPSKGKSPERSCLKKSLSPRNSIECRSPDPDRLHPQHSISPRNSIDSRSPDRSGKLHVRSSSSPRSSFDSRSPDRSYLKSPRESFDSRSPDRNRRSLSASARSSFESTKSSDRGYYIYSSSPYRSESRSPDRQRTSKSLDRSPQESFDSSRYSSHDHYDHPGPVRSYSAENNISNHGVDLLRSNESLQRAIEYPTCVECLLQNRKPS